MSQSLIQVYLHIIFSTKYRRPIILPTYEAELWQYLSMQCNHAGCIALEIGGLISYIRNQHNHHQSQTFEEEYLEILDQYKVNYDPKYLWA